MMTSWFIVCNVWYLPPMKRQENESSVDFASRVKNAIAKQIDVIDLTWYANHFNISEKKTSLHYNKLTLLSASRHSSYIRDSLFSVFGS